MSKPLILELKEYKDNMSKIVAKSKVRLPIEKQSSKRVTFDKMISSGNTERLNFNEDEHVIVIGKGVNKVKIIAKVYVNLLKPGAYCEIKIVKNNDNDVLGNGISYGSEGNETATIRAEAELVEVEEGDKIYLIAYNSNTAASIAIETFIERNLVVEVIE